MLANAATANPLPRAKRLDHNPVAEHCLIRPPTGTATGRSRIVAGEKPIVEQLGFDILQVQMGLRHRVGNNPDIWLPTFDGSTEHIAERGDGRFCAAARTDHVYLEAALGAE